MAGRGSSATVVEPEWVHVGNDIYALGEGSSTTWVRMLDHGHRPSWEELLNLGERFYHWVDARWPAYFRTGSTGSRLVATLCRPHAGGHMVFQSTIPRGAWLNYIKAKGRTEAPNWYAAYSRPRRGEFKEWPHAEDSAEFICDRRMGGFNTYPYDDCRIIVFGLKSGGSIGQVKLCDKEYEKNPTCQQVAKKLDIKFPPNGVSARQMDEDEARTWRPASTNHYTTYSQGRSTGQSGASPSQTRQTTSQGRGSTTSQGQTSTRTSASRTTAAAPPPAGRGATGPRR
jgi:hypothetical protein